MKAIIWKFSITGWSTNIRYIIPYISRVYIFDIAFRYSCMFNVRNKRSKTEGATKESWELFGSYLRQEH